MTVWFGDGDLTYLTLEHKIYHIGVECQPWRSVQFLYVVWGHKASYLGYKKAKEVVPLKYKLYIYIYLYLFIFFDASEFSNYLLTVCMHIFSLIRKEKHYTNLTVIYIQHLRLRKSNNWESFMHLVFTYWLRNTVYRINSELKGNVQQCLTGVKCYIIRWVVLLRMSCPVGTFFQFFPVAILYINKIVLWYIVQKKWCCLLQP